MEVYALLALGAGVGELWVILRDQVRRWQTLT